MRISLVLFFAIVGLIAWVIRPSQRVQDRMYGACLVNPPQPIESTAFNAIKEINVKWVAVIPYGFSRAGMPDVSYDHSRQWWGERTDGNSMMIQYAKENGLKVMCKPHVWVRGQGWTGDFDLNTEEEWEKWEKGYTKYILNHAVKADSMGVELFCIGTEYRIPARERPEFWKGLVKKVRQVYSGKVTYASNWDNYENISWWSEVDYIGVDAYFPLVDADKPSIAEIKEGWEPVKEKLGFLSSKWDKPVLFTEYGFQSVDGAAGKHWEVNKSQENINYQLQADAYEATFQALENEDWFAGGFFWKWHFYTRSENARATAWTPQNKTAEKVIAKWYAN